jgi:hypothetical protein
MAATSSSSSSTHHGGGTSRHVQVTFGRDVTDEDLQKLQQHADVLTARRMPIDADQDHVHTVNQ